MREHGGTKNGEPSSRLRSGHRGRAGWCGPLVGQINELRSVSCDSSPIPVGRRARLAA
jgi:hypothetical protein